MDEITDNPVDSSPKKRRTYMLFLLLGIVGGIVLFAAIAFWYVKRVDVPPPKMPPPVGMLSVATTDSVGTAARVVRHFAIRVRPPLECGDLSPLFVRLTS